MKQHTQHGATKNLGKTLPTLPKCAKVPGKGSIPSTGSPKPSAGINSRGYSGGKKG